MLLDFATIPRGTTYAYFVCSRRASKKTSCTRRAVPIAVAERLVADSYANITISDTAYQRLAAEVDAAFDKRMADRDHEIADLMANRAKLEAESDKLLAAHFADAIDLPTLKRHQDRIRAGLADVNRRLAAHDEHHTGGRAFLHDSLRLLTDAHRAYSRSGDTDRRLANQAFHARLDIADDEQLRPRLAEPFATIIREAHESNSDEGEEPYRNTTILRMSRVPVRHFGWILGESNSRHPACKAGALPTELRTRTALEPFCAAPDFPDCLTTISPRPGRRKTAGEQNRSFPRCSRSASTSARSRLRDTGRHTGEGRSIARPPFGIGGATRT